MTRLTVLAMLLGCLFAAPLFAQEKPADNMQILREKIQADKKLVVAEAMDLTEGEAKAFWPVYQAYQKDLQALGDRMVKLIREYAAGYKTMTDDAAKKLLNDYVALEQDRLKLMQSYLPKFRSVIPHRKVARYYQIENKIRAAINYELASAIPLVK